jgi:SAM-dependent methyltransferase
MAFDWSLGRYERIAAQLLPAARAVVERAEVQAGERVVDVGTGSGNAALLAAERGAVVTGVDPALRLLEVARERTAGLNADFAPGDAADLPLADGEADVVLSVFGVIFAPDVVAAARELTRVLAPGGRLVLSAWIPEGAMSRSARVPREALARGEPPGPPPFAWHSREALAGLFGREVTVSEERLVFTGPSAARYVDDELADHPMAVAGRPVLESRGELDAVRDEMIAILDDANEDPDGFRVTSRYVVAVVR